MSAVLLTICPQVHKESVPQMTAISPLATSYRHAPPPPPSNVQRIYILRFGTGGRAKPGASLYTRKCFSLSAPRYTCFALV